MKDRAREKLDGEAKAMRGGNRYTKVLCQPVHDALVSFCEQDGEFAQAVVQGGSLADCLAAITQGLGSAISDLDLYRKAVQYYFPTAEVRMQMTVQLCPDAPAPEAPERRTAKPELEQKMVLDLFELL